MFKLHDSCPPYSHSTNRSLRGSLSTSSISGLAARHVRPPPCSYPTFFVCRFYTLLESISHAQGVEHSKKCEHEVLDSEVAWFQWMEAPLICCLEGPFDPIATFTHIESIYGTQDDHPYGDVDATTLIDSINHTISDEASGKSISNDRLGAFKSSWLSSKFLTRIKVGSTRLMEKKCSTNVELGVDH